MLLGTGAGAHMNATLGGRVAVATGTLIAAAGVAVQAAFIDGSSYVPTGVGLLLFGLGAGIAMPAATDLIMATLPPARAGVGSAVNDTVRELGGALGVAVIGSVAATNYAASLQSELTRHPRHQRPRTAPADRQRRQRPSHERSARSERSRDRVDRPDGVRELDERRHSGWPSASPSPRRSSRSSTFRVANSTVHAAPAHGTVVHVETIAVPVVNSAT